MEDFMMKIFKANLLLLNFLIYNTIKYHGADKTIRATSRKAVTLKVKTAKELEVIALKCLALILRCKDRNFPWKSFQNNILIKYYPLLKIL